MQKNPHCSLCRRLWGALRPAGGRDVWLLLSPQHLATSLPPQTSPLCASQNHAADPFLRPEVPCWHGAPGSGLLSWGWAPSPALPHPLLPGAPCEGASQSPSPLTPLSPCHTLKDHLSSSLLKSKLSPSGLSLPIQVIPLLRTWDH